MKYNYENWDKNPVTVVVTGFSAPIYKSVPHCWLRRQGSNLRPVGVTGECPR